MPEIVMPRLSDSMEEGTIIRWLVSEGDTVSRGDEIVEIETDKATMTYEADADGEIAFVASEGDTLAIGSVIARVGEGAASSDGEASGDSDGEGSAAPADSDGEASDAPADSDGEASASGGGGEADSPAPVRQTAAPSAGEPSSPPVPDAAGRGAEGNGRAGERVKASPIARRLASEQGVDLAALSGSGPGGRIVRADVEAASEGGAPAAAPAREERAPAAAGAPGAAKGEVESVEPTRTQQTIARRMAESRATVPDFTLQVDVDMDQAWQGREALKASAGEEDPVPSFNDLVVKACALALREFPRVNGAYRDGRFERYSRVNVGVAVAVPDALVVPTVFDADRKTLGEIARESRELAQRVRDGSITPPELSGATFTVSNLGMYGVRDFTAVINPPQAAILSVGAVEERAVVRDGQVVPGRRMGMSLACDHRVLYGADAAEFLARVRARLEAPLGLAL